jgi:hypothetical protein
MGPGSRRSAPTVAVGCCRQLVDPVPVGVQLARRRRWPGDDHGVCSAWPPASLPHPSRSHRPLPARSTSAPRSPPSTGRPRGGARANLRSWRSRRARALSTRRRITLAADRAGSSSSFRPHTGRMRAWLARPATTGQPLGQPTLRRGCSPMDSPINGRAPNSRASCRPRWRSPGVVGCSPVSRVVSPSRKARGMLSNAGTILSRVRLREESGAWHDCGWASSGQVGRRRSPT